MRLLPFAVALAVAIAAPAALPAMAADAGSSMMMAMQPAAPLLWTAGDLVISGAYARATLPNAPVGGGYLTIVNNGAADDTLVSATSPAAGAVQLHDMTTANGVMSMRPVPAGGLPIPAGKTVALTPNGLHLMLTDLTGPLVKGQAVPVTLIFARAGAVTVQLAIGDIAASAPPAAASMSAPAMSAPAMSAPGGGMGGMKMNGMSM